MKKTLSIICVVAMLATLLASCNVHEHSFATDAWTHDSDFHWHACTVDSSCGEKADKAAHDFEIVSDEEGNLINKCKVCAATNTNVPSAPEHEHVFSEELASSENFHWYPCTVEGCYEESEKAEHIFGNPEIEYADGKLTLKSVCVDCLYENVEVQEVETEVSDSLSWDDAFKNFKLTNFSMNVMVEYTGNPPYVGKNHCVVTEKSAYYCVENDREFYTVLNDDGTCTTYMYDFENKVFVKLNDTSDVYLKGAQVETVLQVSFEDNFDKFTYDEETASYVCAEVIEAVCYDFNGNVYDTLYCYNNVVKLVDGKIAYISADYYFEESDLVDTHFSFEYYNIGMTVVEIPQSVIDGAVPDDGSFDGMMGGDSSDGDNIPEGAEENT